MRKIKGSTYNSNVTKTVMSGGVTFREQCFILSENFCTALFSVGHILFIPCLGESNFNDCNLKLMLMKRRLLKYICIHIITIIFA